MSNNEAYSKYVRHEVLTAVTMSITVFQHVRLSSPEHESATSIFRVEEYATMGKHTDT